MTHFHGHEVSIGICFVLGILHALEPGHGKTAFVAHLLTEKRNVLRPFLLALTTAVTHALSILFIAVFIHTLMHVTLSSDSHELHSWLVNISGGLLIFLGVYFFVKAFQSKKHQHENHTSCSCTHHKKTSVVQSDDNKKWQTMAIGFAVGLIPCPSALAALSTALVSKDLVMAFSVIGMFSLGIFISLSLVGSLFSYLSTTVHNLSFLKRNSNFINYAQAVALTLTGVWHMFLSAGH